MPSHDDPDEKQVKFVKRGDLQQMVLLAESHRYVVKAGEGRFHLMKHTASTGRNPQTGADLQIPDSWPHIHEDVKPANTEIAKRSDELLNKLAEGPIETGIGDDEPVAAPPTSFWLSAMLPADTSEEIIANMEVLYRDKWLPRHGKFRADWVWRLQEAQFILWRWTWPVMSLLGALKLIKLG